MDDEKIPPTYDGTVLRAADTGNPFVGYSAVNAAPPNPPKHGLAYVAELTSMQLGECKDINGTEYIRLPHGWLLPHHDILIPPFGTEGAMHVTKAE